MASSSFFTTSSASSSSSSSLSSFHSNKSRPRTLPRRGEIKREIFASIFASVGRFLGALAAEEGENGDDSQSGVGSRTPKSDDSQSGVGSRTPKLDFRMDGDGGLSADEGRGLGRPVRSSPASMSSGLRTPNSFIEPLSCPISFREGMQGKG